MSTTTITARVAEPGVHRWPDAPPERAYLASLHRHLFVARAVVYVDHHDRSVEFHDLGDDLRAALRGCTGALAYGEHSTSLLNFGPQSCEHLATSIAATLASRYAVAEVSVSEDDEFTSTVYPDPIALTGSAATTTEEPMP